MKKTTEQWRETFKDIKFEDGKTELTDDMFKMINQALGLFELPADIQAMLCHALDEQGMKQFMRKDGSFDTHLYSIIFARGVCEAFRLYADSVRNAGYEIDIVPLPSKRGPDNVH